MQCKVSVIIPFFNAAAYLSDCVRSVCAQTLREIEILLVDDGSTDGSAELAERFAAEDARIRVFRQPHLGVSAARNLALEQARGEYIGFADADDLTAPQMYARLYETAKETQSEIVTCAYSSFRAGGVIRTYAPYAPAGSTRLTHEDVLDAMPVMSTQRTFRYVWRRLISAALIGRENLRFHPDISVGEDTLFCLDCFLSANGAAVLNEPLYLYRHHDGSVMRQKTYNDDLLRSLSLQYDGKKARCARYCPAQTDVFLRDAAMRCYTDQLPMLLRNLFRKPDGRWCAFRQIARSSPARDMCRYLPLWRMRTRSMDWVAVVCLRLHLNFAAYCIEKRIFGKDT